jgi:predicted CoA-substrate-specific enzyme activase
LRFVLGVDVGSVSVKMAVLDEDKNMISSVYLETAGDPVGTVLRALREVEKEVAARDIRISGVGVTGSGRVIAQLILGADLVKNEVTAQAVSGLHFRKDVASIIEIGGQDSKTIILKNGIPVWHNLNALCSAGTGSFLSSQAYRLKVPIEEFGEYALKSDKNVNIASKCTVFSESDMIHKAASGYKKEDIIKGLCDGLARNFINNIARNRKLEGPTIFAGGVAANRGVVKAFERELGHEVIVPREHKIMGCIGVALLVLREKVVKTDFKGFEVSSHKITPELFQCCDCPNQCEITRLSVNGKVAGHLNSRCGKHH